MSPLLVRSNVDVRHRGSNAAFSHHRVRLAKQRLAHNGDARAMAQRLDRRGQSSAAGADDQHIMLVSLELFVHSNLKS